MALSVFSKRKSSCLCGHTQCHCWGNQKLNHCRGFVMMHSELQMAGHISDLTVRQTWPVQTSTAFLLGHLNYFLHHPLLFSFFFESLSTSFVLPAIFPKENTQPERKSSSHYLSSEYQFSILTREPYLVQLLWLRWSGKSKIEFWGLADLFPSPAVLFFPEYSHLSPGPDVLMKIL